MDGRKMKTIHTLIKHISSQIHRPFARLRASDHRLRHSIYQRPTIAPNDPPLVHQLHGAETTKTRAETRVHAQPINSWLFLIARLCGCRRDMIAIGCKHIFDRRLNISHLLEDELTPLTARHTPPVRLFNQPTRLHDTW